MKRTPPPACRHLTVRLQRLRKGRDRATGGGQGALEL